MSNIGSLTGRASGLPLFKLGFADPSWMDVDSTTQEANIAYPSDATLMRKLAQKCKLVFDYLIEKKKKFLPANISIDMKSINAKAKGYFFLAKNAALEKKRKIFRDYHHVVKEELKDFIKFTEDLPAQKIEKLPWNIKKSINQIKEDGWRYLLDVAHFIRNQKIKAGKILSFHAKEVICIKKGKIGKEHEFGRRFQLGRIGGNFLVPFTSTDLQMEDKKQLINAVKEHGEIFGHQILKSIGTDKGYHSQKNIKTIETMGITADGIQRPINIKKSPSEEIARPLRDRRAGIEPLIGHAKCFGLGKSRMKSDNATLASGYRSVMGFNLNQMKRKMSLKEEKKTA